MGRLVAFGNVNDIHSMLRIPKRQHVRLWEVDVRIRTDLLPKIAREFGTDRNPLYAPALPHTDDNESTLRIGERACQFAKLFGGRQRSFEVIPIGFGALAFSKAVDQGQSPVTRFTRSPWLGRY